MNTVAIFFYFWLSVNKGEPPHNMPENSDSSNHGIKCPCDLCDACVKTFFHHNVCINSYYFR